MAKKKRNSRRHPKQAFLALPPARTKSATLSSPSLGTLNACIAEAILGSNLAANGDDIDLSGSGSPVFAGITWDSSNTFDSSLRTVVFEADCGSGPGPGQATWSVDGVGPPAQNFAGGSIASVIVVAGVQNYAMVQWSSLKVTYFDQAGNADATEHYNYGPRIDARDFSAIGAEPVEFMPPDGSTRTKVRVEGKIELAYNPDDIGTPGPTDLYAQVIVNTFT